MNELEKQLKDHSLTIHDIVLGENHYGNPKFNPELLDLLIDKEIKPKEFWGSYNLDSYGDLRFYFHIFTAAYAGRKRRRKKRNENH